MHPERIGLTLVSTGIEGKAFDEWHLRVIARVGPPLLLSCRTIQSGGPTATSDAKKLKFHLKTLIVRGIARMLATRK